MNMPGWLNQKIHRVWGILWLAVKKFWKIDGGQSAAAFAFTAFFSMFPLMVLSITIASAFIDQAETKVIAYVEMYIPVSGDMKRYIVSTIAGVVEDRGQAGLAAFIMLVWAAMQFFSILTYATNRAWGAKAYSWWRLPLKSLIFLAIMVCSVLLGIAMPVLAKMAKDWLFPMNDFRSWVYALGSFFIPLLVVFLGLSLFYKMAPRRPMRFAEVWVAALCATMLLLLDETLFMGYLKNFAKLNAVYGTFGGIMALLLWIYLFGCIFIFGACLCASQAERRSPPVKTPQIDKKDGA